MSIQDLHQLHHLEEMGIKVNKSDLARRFNVDRRTIDKYINGYQKPKNRNKSSQYDLYYEIIKTTLEDKSLLFGYKRSLWKYLVEQYGLQWPESSFRRYIDSKEELNRYFIKKDKK